MKTIFPILFLCLLSAVASAQTPKPLGERNYVGFEVGPDYGWLSGAQNFVLQFIYPLNYSDSRAVYPISLDKPGSGIGFHIGGTVDINLSGAWNFTGKFFYSHQSTKSTEQKTIALTSDFGKQMSVNFLNQTTGTGDFSTTLEQGWSYLGGDVLLRYQIAAESFYALAGFEFSGLINNSIHITQSITGSSSGSLKYKKYKDPTNTGVLSSTIEIPDGGTSGLYKGLWAGPKVGIGSFFAINEKWILAPELSISIPLTDLYEDPYTPPKDPNDATFNQKQVTFASYISTAPKLWYAQLSIGLKFPFGMKKHTEEIPEK
jgi:hypothetical protein